jgi:predicted Fe-Mo cluster-binding NifX family protein
MKVAVSSTGDSMESGVDPRFGRCPTFIVVDTESDEYKAVNNSSAGSAHGAGIGAAQAVAQLGVEAVITGHVGPNAHMALSRAGIKIYTVEGGSVREALEGLKEGSLTSVTAPTVGGHFGQGGRGGRGQGRRRTG